METLKAVRTIRFLRPRCNRHRRHKSQTVPSIGKLFPLSGFPKPKTITGILESVRSLFFFIGSRSHHNRQSNSAPLMHQVTWRRDQNHRDPRRSAYQSVFSSFMALLHRRHSAKPFQVLESSTVRGVPKTKSQESWGSVPFLYSFSFGYSVTIPTIGRQISLALCPRVTMGLDCNHNGAKRVRTIPFSSFLVGHTITVTIQKPFQVFGRFHCLVFQNKIHEESLGYPHVLYLFFIGYFRHHHNRPSNSLRLFAR